jgi:hypothetical protein
MDETPSLDDFRRDHAQGALGNRIHDRSTAVCELGLPGLDPVLHYKDRSSLFLASLLSQKTRTNPCRLPQRINQT